MAIVQISDTFKKLTIITSDHAPSDAFNDIPSGVLIHL